MDLKRTVLNIFGKIDAPINLQNIEICRRLKSDDNGRSNKVIVKFSKRKDIVRVINKKKSLKNANLDGTGLPPRTSLFFNLVFAVITSTCGLNVKHYGLVN